MRGEKTRHIPYKYRAQGTEAKEKKKNRREKLSRTDNKRKETEGRCKEK
jgi:hypothetical protein